MTKHISGEKENLKEFTLEDKYKSLKTFKTFLQFFAWFVTLCYAYLARQTLIYGVGGSVSFSIFVLAIVLIAIPLSWYLILSLIKMINFLFDLDKHRNENS